MRIIEKQQIDWEKPLPNEKQEAFCQEYVRLDMEEGVKQDRARRIEAYRFAFPDSNMTPDGQINSRAQNLLRKDIISSRLNYLYEELGAGIENKVKWTQAKAEDALLEIVYGEEKTENKLRAIDMINKIREIGVKKEVEDKTGTIEAFLNKFRSKG